MAAALGGLSASAGRSGGGTGTLMDPFELMEPMRSSSARNVSLASMLAPTPSMERVLRWFFPAGAQISAWVWTHCPTYDFHAAQQIHAQTHQPCTESQVTKKQQ